MKKLNLGCGRDIKEGYINVDMEKLPGVDIVANVEKGLPIEDNSIDEVYTAHFLEHVYDLHGVIEEIYRICKDKAKVIIRVPHFTTNTYEFHIRPMRYMSFMDYTDEGGMHADTNWFKVKKRKLVFGGFYKPFQFLNLLPKIYENTFIRSFIFCSEIYIELEAIKREEPKEES